MSHLTDAERELLRLAVSEHRSARAVPMGGGGIGWTCEGCGQPLGPENPSEAFRDLTSHQTAECAAAVERILAARLAAVEAERDSAKREAADIFAELRLITGERDRAVRDVAALTRNYVGPLAAVEALADRADARVDTEHRLVTTTALRAALSARADREERT